MDPDGRDITKSELFQFSESKIFAADIQVGLAIDSNGNVAIYVQAYVGAGYSASLAKYDDILKIFDKIADYLSHSENFISAAVSVLQPPEDTGKGNLDKQIDFDYSWVGNWLEDGGSIPITAGLLVGVSTDEEGNFEMEVGVNAEITVYLAEFTAYIDLDYFLELSSTEEITE